MTGVLIRGKSGHKDSRHMQIQREEGYGTVEAGTGGPQLAVHKQEDCWQQPQVRKRQGSIFPGAVRGRRGF